MSLKDSPEKYLLIGKVEISDSKEEIENDVNSALKEAADILKTVHKGGNPELTEKFEKEYSDLKKSIKDSLESDNIITKEELVKIKLELSDVMKLGEQNGIVGTTSITSKVTNYFTGAENEKIKHKTRALIEKNISNYSKSDAMGALAYLNQSYNSSKYQQEAGNVKKALLKVNIDNSISEIGTKQGLNAFQEALIKIIMGDDGFEKGHDNTSLRGFNKSERGNYLVSISEFESTSFGIDAADLNPMALANYFLHLEEKGNLNKENLIKTFGRKTLSELGKLWKADTNDKNKQIAKRILIDKGLGDIIKDTINYSELFKLDGFSFSKEIEYLSEEDIQNAYKYISENDEDRETYLNNNRTNSNGKDYYICPIQPKAINMLSKAIKIDYDVKFSKQKQEIIKKFTDRLNGDKKLAENLYENIETSIDENACTFDLIETFNNFNNKQLKRYNKENPKNKIKNFNNSEIKKGIEDILRLETQKNTAVTQELSRSLQLVQNKKENASLEEQKQLIASEVYLKTTIDSFKQKSVAFERVATVTNTLEDTDIDTVIESINEGKTNEEIMTDLRKTNKKLDTALIKFEEKYKKEDNEIIKESGEEKAQTSININSKNQFIPTEENYSRTDGGFILKGENGETIEGLVISEKEKNNTIGNPEATKNLINFYKFFEDINMLGVWKYRREFITAIGDITINPNDSDSIKEEELRKFGNRVLTFIANIESDGENKEKIQLNDLNSVELKLREFSGAQSGLSDSKTYNIEGEDKLTSYLREKGIIGGAYFHTNKFRENL